MTVVDVAFFGLFWPYVKSVGAFVYRRNKGERSEQLKQQ